MKIQLFGNLQLELHNGETIQLQADKVSALLVYLATNADRQLQRSQLANLLWGGYPERDARRNLTNTLSRLKKLLPSTASHLATTRQTITLTDDNLFVDSRQFDRLWSQCATVKRSLWADDGQVVQQLTELVALYQGGFADGLTLPDCIEFETWAALQLEKYQQQALTALETLAAHHLAQHVYDSAETYAQRQLALEPWREIAHRQLIQFYVATGRHSAAVAQLDRCKRLLWDELGVEPSAETVAALQAPVAASAPVANRRTARRSAQRGGGVNRRGRRAKRSESNAFFGREAELAQLRRLTADPETWLITLHGEGGMGKTRLAQAAGAMFSAEFEDGVRFVQLVSVNEPSAITSTIIETIGLRLQGKADPFDQLCDYLADQQLLLILDNLEHLLAAGEDEVIDQLLDLLEAAPDVVLLVTSRQRLWVQMERIVRLRGLPHPVPPADHTWQKHEAVQLFIARVQQSDPDFDPAQAQEPIIQICRLVEGLPLGIELAAAQSSTWTVETVAEELTRGMVLSTRMRDIPKRQRSLKTVFNYSWGLLEEGFRPILAKAAIMRGDFSYEVFHAVTGGSYTDLEMLLAHALIRKTSDNRFNIHEMVRQFAFTHLSANELKIVQYRHFIYFFEFITQREQSILDKPETSIPAIRQEWAHIEQAWIWALEQNALDVFYDAVRALCNYWYLGGHTATTLPMLATAQAQIASQMQHHPMAHSLKMELHGLQIWVGFLSAPYNTIIGWIQTVLDKKNRDISPFATAVALFTRGTILFVTGRFTEAVETLDKGYQLAKQHKIYVWELVITRIYTMALANYGRLQEAERSAKRNYDLSSQRKTDLYIDQSLSQFAWMQVWKWELSAGIASYEHVIKIRTERVFTRRVNTAMTTLAFAYYKVGAFERVNEILYLAERPGVRDNHPHLDNGGYYVLSYAKRRLGDLEKAIEYGQLAVDRTNNFGAGVFHLWARAALGLALCAAERWDEAQNVLREAQSRLQNSEASDNWFTLIEGSLAHVYAAAKDWQSAYQLVQALYDRLIIADPIYTRVEQTWYCYQILDHCNDPRASELLQHARRVLDYRIAQLTPEHQHIFINNFPEHQQILAFTNSK